MLTLDLNHKDSLKKGYVNRILMIIDFLDHLGLMYSSSLNPENCINNRNMDVKEILINRGLHSSDPNYEKN